MTTWHSPCASSARPNAEIKKRVPYVLELVGLKTRAGACPTSCPAASSRELPLPRAGQQSADDHRRRADRKPRPRALAGNYDAAGTDQRPRHNHSHGGYPRKELVNRFTKRVVAINEGKSSATEWMGTISMKKNNIGYLLREGFKGCVSARLHVLCGNLRDGCVLDHHGHVQPDSL